MVCAAEVWARTGPGDLLPQDGLGRFLVTRVKGRGSMGAGMVGLCIWCEDVGLGGSNRGEDDG